MSRVALSAALRFGHHTQVTRVDELQVLERSVGLAADRVVRELVDARESQTIEVGGPVVQLVRLVSDLGRRRYVTGDSICSRRVTPVAGRATQAVRRAERVWILQSRPGVVIVRGPVVAGHA